MSKRYLFSPIGNTDPIKYQNDGSMLHICRHYKPDVVYLYLSKEMVENERKDQRYTKTIQLLGEALHHEFEVHLIERVDLVEVQQYDLFYQEFRENIIEIEKNMAAGDELIVNMASGTPAMKSALMTMATLAEYRFLPILVSSPKKSSNLEYEAREEYDVLENWECDLDNEEGAENRCTVGKSLHLVRLLKIDIIKKHLLAYDYSAALAVAKNMRRDLNDTAYKWIQIAAARAALDWDRMNLFIKDDKDIISAMDKNNKKKILFEYTLTLELKMKRGEYADFVRAITPLGVDLLELVLEHYCDIEISKYYVPRKVTRTWDRNKRGMGAIKILEEYYKPRRAFNYGTVYSSHLNILIQEKCKDIKLKKAINDFVTVEQKVRNVAAHSTVSVTEEWMKAQIGKTVRGIMENIKFICEKVEVKSIKENWNAYDTMNARIIEELDRQV